MSLFGGGTGVEIPKGDPDALSAAAGLWDGLGDALDTQASSLTSAASVASGADWFGAASAAYSGATMELTFAMQGAGESCRQAASACRHHGHLLKEAQDDAKDARKDATDAIERGSEAEDKLADAQSRSIQALGAAGLAEGRALIARAAGPLGEADAQAAEADQRAALAAAGDAAQDAKRAQARIDAAKADLDRARERGEKANKHAIKAGERAAGVLGDVAAAAKPPDLAIQPAVPITIREQVNPLTGVPVTPLFGPGGFTPGDIRKRQIAAAEARRRQQEEDRQGGFDDSFGGMAAAWLGTDLGIGDPKTSAYRGNQRFNQALTFVPTPASARAQAQRRLRKKGMDALDEGYEQAARHFAQQGKKPLSPYVIRLDPKRGGPLGVDTGKFRVGRRTETTANGGVRDAKQFWKTWSTEQQQTLSQANRDLIATRKAPVVDDEWLKHYPEHAPWKGKPLVHHHVDQGKVAIPLPEPLHRFKPHFRIWHPK
jgi:HNH/Endo VII superfamily nuclease toxin with a HHH motif/PPE family